MKIRIDRKTGFAYIPKELREKGFQDDCEVQPNAVTLTIIKPGTQLENVKKSLQIALKDVELRIELQKEDQ